MHREPLRLRDAHAVLPADQRSGSLRLLACHLMRPRATATLSEAIWYSSLNAVDCVGACASAITGGSCPSRRCGSMRRSTDTRAVTSGVSFENGLDGHDAATRQSPAVEQHRIVGLCLVSSGIVRVASHQKISVAEGANAMSSDEPLPKGSGIANDAGRSKVPVAGSTRRTAINR